MSSPRAVTVRFLALAIACLGCSQDAMIRRFTPADADARSRAYLSLLTRGQVDSAEARLAPSLAGPEAHQGMQQIVGLMRGQRFDSLRVIGANVGTFNGVRHVNLTYEFHGGTQWILANVATVDTDGSWVVEGVSARQIDQPLERLNAFSLRGRSARHYLWLLLTIFCAAASLGTAVFIVTRRRMPRRWGWAALALVGVGAFALDWSTGATYVRPINVQLFAAGVMRAGPAAPWVLTFALPLGAFVAFLRYLRWRAGARTASPAGDASWEETPA